MATIKGLTLEIGGDTTELTAALSGVNEKTKSLQRELKDVDKLLKFDPTNTELLAQKQEILTSAISETEKKLETLKTAAAQAKEKLELGEITEEQYRALEREVAKTEQTLQKLETEAGKAGKEVDDMGDEAEQSERQLNGLKAAGELTSAALLAVAAAAAAVALKVGKMTIEAGEAADEINTLAKQTGLSTEEIQKFQFAAEQIDVPLETLTGSMARLTRNMNTASGGTGDAYEAFEALGVSISDANGELRNNKDVFNDTINALASIENETQRDAYAMSIFGKSAQELNPLILGGADALEELGKQAEEAGIILSQEQLDSLNGVADAVDTLKATATGAGRLFVTQFAEPLSSGIETVTELVSRLSTAFAEGGFDALADEIGNVLTDALDYISNALPRVMEVGTKIVLTLANSILQSLPSLITSLVDVVSTVIVTLSGQLPSIVESIAEVIPLIITALIEAIPTLLEAATTLLFAIVEAIPTVIDGILSAMPSVIDAIIGSLVGSYQVLVNAAVQLLRAIIDALPDIIETLTESLPDIITALVDALVEAYPLLLEASVILLMAIIDAIPQIVDQVVTNFPAVFRAVFSAIKEATPKLLEMAKAYFEQIVLAIPTIFDKLKEAIGNLTDTAKNYLTNGFSDIWEIGENIVKGIWNGISGATTWLKNKITGWTSGIVDSITDFLGISSPSKLMADLVGKNMALGLGDGFMSQMNTVAREMQSALPTDMESRVGYSVASVPDTTAQEQSAGLVNALSTALIGAGGGAGDLIVNLVVNGQDFARATIQNFRNVASQQGQIVGEIA